jgi:hypothetical protein
MYYAGYAVELFRVRRGVPRWDGGGSRNTHLGSHLLFFDRDYCDILNQTPVTESKKKALFLF